MLMAIFGSKNRIYIKAGNLQQKAFESDHLSRPNKNSLQSCVTKTWVLNFNYSALSFNQRIISGRWKSMKIQFFYTFIQYTGGGTTTHRGNQERKKKRPPGLRIAVLMVRHPGGKSSSSSKFLLYSYMVRSQVSVPPPPAR
uniref:(northern house mosquito) hypothetical protein n=1 Tax=Culex pipiens TaxID=7175 RepID=A0A8D8P4D4_CULPI